jgi:hypothetical protein
VSKPAKKKATPARSTSVLPSANDLARVVERQMEMVRSHKTRQDDIVRGLGTIQKLIGLGSFEAAVTAMADLMARDLKQAKDRQDNHAFALDIAIKALERRTKERDAVDALSQIEVLVPEAFEKTGVTAAASDS